MNQAKLERGSVFHPTMFHAGRVTHAQALLLCVPVRIGARCFQVEPSSIGGRDPRLSCQRYSGGANSIGDYEREDSLD